MSITSLLAAIVAGICIGRTVASLTPADWPRGLAQLVGLPVTVTLCLFVVWGLER